MIATVLKSGLHTTIQDLGRTEQRHFGVPQSGAADPISFALANAAIGNPPNAAALECTLNGPTIRFSAECEIALAGAPMKAMLNEEALEFYSPIKVSPGDVLSIGAAPIGARCYIAFVSGLAGQRFLNSVSTYPPALIGGLDGHPIRADDTLSLMGLETTSPKDIPTDYRPVIAHDFFLRALEGPEFEQLTEKSQRQLFSGAWTIGRRADRMGLQLESTPLTLDTNKPMASSAVFPGTVQCPADGSPFLLSVDAQTIGGYPRIAQIIAADLPPLGQMRPGDKLWFQKITPSEARDITATKSALLGAYLPGGFFR
ncbi:biotin-dependent carboxyltransferase family protein [Hyphococcus formosus]|uniref:5-oxoprolinase subunit C family protein n=1 Tax=Hyphococcus formosus TaxID=3143534 RepID=UPI00398AAE12